MGMEGNGKSPTKSIKDLSSRRENIKKTKRVEGKLEKKVWSEQSKM